MKEMTCERCVCCLVEKDENCEGDDYVIWCNTCQSHNSIKYVNAEDNDCYIDTCDLCNDKNCYAHGYIGDCVKCDKVLCYDCCRTFWCYECEDGFCCDCEELVNADGTYCKPCAVKLNL